MKPRRFMDRQALEDRSVLPRISDWLGVVSGHGSDFATGQDRRGSLRVKGCDSPTSPPLQTSYRTTANSRSGPQADIQIVLRDRLFRRHAARLDRSRPFRDVVPKKSGEVIRTTPARSDGLDT